MDRSIFCCPLAVAADHSNCIEMLTKKLVPAVISESVRCLPENGQLVLDDVEQVFADCRRKAALPSELGYRWK